jgi:hypothetical protein
MKVVNHTYLIYKILNGSISLPKNCLSQFRCLVHLRLHIQSVVKIHLSLTIQISNREETNKVPLNLQTQSPTCASLHFYTHDIRSNGQTYHKEETLHALKGEKDHIRCWYMFSLFRSLSLSLSLFCTVHSMHSGSDRRSEF